MSRILMVLTSHDKLGDTDQQTGWYLPEAAHPHEVFSKAGCRLTYASIKGGAAPLDAGSVDASKADEVCQTFLKESMDLTKKTIALAEAKADDYDVLFYVGGFGTMWDFPDCKESVELCKTMYEQGKIVSAVCHGPVALVNVKLSDGSYLLKDKACTGFTNAEEDAVQRRSVVPYTCEDKMAERGGKFSDGGVFTANVKIDGNLFTGQNPPSAGPLAEAIVKALNQGKKKTCEAKDGDVTRHLHVGSEKADVAQEVSEFILQKYNEAVKTSDKFTLAFSGGSLPAIVADGILANKGYSSVDFSKWIVFFADERCVALNNADSNYKSVKEKLLDKFPAIKQENVYPIDENLVSNPAAAAAAYQKNLEKVFGGQSVPEFDLILLGMGEDGHTCSLFPGHPLTAYRGDNWVESITDSPKMPPERITLTFPVLAKAKEIAFVATGDGKKEILYGIFKEDNKNNYPAGTVRNCKGEVDWFVDKAGAAKL